MSAGRSQHTATSSMRRRQEAERAVAEERERAAVAAAAAAAEGDAAAILEQMPNFDFNKEILEFQNDRGMELKQHIRDFTEENPEIAAQLLKNWLNGGVGEK